MIRSLREGHIHCRKMRKILHRHEEIIFSIPPAELARLPPVAVSLPACSPVGGTREGRQPPPGWLRGLAARPCGSSLASVCVCVCLSVSVCPCLCENHEEKRNRQDLGWTQCNSLFWAVAGNSTGLEARQGCGLRTGLGSAFATLAFVIVCHSPGTRCLLYLPTGPNGGRR